VNTILLATDGSPSAGEATALAIELAHATGAKLHIVTAWSIPVSSLGTYPAFVSTTAEFAEDEQAHARHVLQAAAQAASDADLEAQTVLRRGEAADAICAVATEVGADLLVVGSHGWNPIRRLVLGSVSTRVLHHAHCPVMVARGTPVPARDEELVQKEAALTI
jgi:nucleotide-binding universal stress UspA family protein